MEPDRILAAARELFLKEGFEAVPVRAIARRAGCSAGLIYHYFSNKEELMARVVEDTFTRLDASLAGCLDHPGSALDRLGSALRAYIRFGLDHPHDYAFLFAHNTEKIDPHVLNVFRTKGTGCFERLRDLCQESMRAGLLREELTDPNEITQALWASIHGMVHLLCSVKGFPFVNRKPLIERHVEILLRGIRRG